jgi:3-(methylthio)propanoyl-CoA dehydrogenase
MTRELQELKTADAAVATSRRGTLEAVGLLKSCTDTLVGAWSAHPDTAMAVSVPYLMMCGYVVSAWLTTRSAAIAASKQSGPDRSFYESKVHTARFYTDQVLPRALGLARIVQSGAGSVTETDAALI